MVRAENVGQCGFVVHIFRHGNAQDFRVLRHCAEVQFRQHQHGGSGQQEENYRHAEHSHAHCKAYRDSGENRRDFTRRTGHGAEAHERERPRDRQPRANAAVDHHNHQRDRHRQERQRQREGRGVPAAAREHQRGQNAQHQRRRQTQQQCGDSQWCGQNRGQQRIKTHVQFLLRCSVCAPSGEYPASGAQGGSNSMCRTWRTTTYRFCVGSTAAPATAGRRLRA